jgi:hypothetical protein
MLAAGTKSTSLKAVKSAIETVTTKAKKPRAKKMPKPTKSLPVDATNAATLAKAINEGEK